MNAYQYIDKYRVAILKSSERQLEEERIDLRKNYEGAPNDFDTAWQQFLKINEGKFTNVPKQ